MSTRIRILIAEDSEPMRKAICALLANELGIAVCGQASNYNELLRIHDECDPDVVLMDLRMPGQDQIETERVKEQLSPSCLLAMSFANDTETKNLAKAYGAFKLLDKFNLASTLLPAIEECMRDNRKVQHA
jgi:two-component system, NarL family, response regulator LiaR